MGATVILFHLFEEGGGENQPQMRVSTLACLGIESSVDTVPQIINREVGWSVVKHVEELVFSA